jgi:hypothetical protein
MPNGFSSPVMFNLPGYSPPAVDSPVDGSTPPTKGESVIYKIPPAFWILFFMLVGYVGMRAVMED